MGFMIDDLRIMRYDFPLICNTLLSISKEVLTNPLLKAKQKLDIMKKLIHLLLLFISCLCFNSCEEKATNTETVAVEESTTPSSKVGLNKYISVKLTTDISQLSDKEKQMLPILIEAAKIMDELFWYEAYGTKEKGH